MQHPPSGVQSGSAGGVYLATCSKEDFEASISAGKLESTAFDLVLNCEAKVM